MAYAGTWQPGAILLIRTVPRLYLPFCSTGPRRSLPPRLPVDYMPQSPVCLLYMALLETCRLLEKVYFYIRDRVALVLMASTGTNYQSRVRGCSMISIIPMYHFRITLISQSKFSHRGPIRMKPIFQMPSSEDVPSW